MSLEFPPLPDFQVTPGFEVFLGYDAEDLQPCWAGERDSVCVVGPPGSGKSSGIVIPTLLNWAGPAVVTSTRGDLLAATGNWRAQIAGARGGRVYVYDPFGSIRGVESLRWSPLVGCVDPELCYRRVAAMTAVSGQGIEDGDHWRDGAARILRAYFHAAAIATDPPRSLVDVRTWLARHDVDTAANILTASGSPAAYWGMELAAMQYLGDRERGSFFSLATDTLEAAASPRVLASTHAPEFDVDRFLATDSTLYVVGPSHYQRVAAPMIVGLIDSIAQGAAEKAEAEGGRLSRALLLGLDEVPNIAPLDSLPALVSEGGGRGINTLWGAQSLAQMRARYGVDQQQAILAATTCKIIYGGVSNGNDLRDISAWAGEEREAAVTTFGAAQSGELAPNWRGSTVGGLAGGAAPVPVVGNQGDAGGSFSVGSVYRPVLPPDVIQQTPQFYAWLWHRTDAPKLVETRPAGLTPAYQRLSGYTAAAAGGGRP
jgi:type IV secretion system protein VirD4